MAKVTIDEWKRCYPSRWKGVITDESMAHPAKFSSKLIQKIYDHLDEEGWCKPGDKVLDPFGGVALGALYAMRKGMTWVGIELEQHFVDLGRGNIDLWNKTYSRLPGWGNAVLLQGDSRDLLHVIDEADMSVSSPPWMEVLDDTQIDQQDRRMLADKLGISNSEHVSPIDMEKIGKRVRRGYSGDKFEGVVSSPPYADGAQHQGGDSKPGKLKGGTLRLPGLSGVVSSPPYSGSMEHGGGIDPEKSGHAYGPNSQMANSDTRYGSTPGQLGAMPAHDFDAAISSPPFGEIQRGEGIAAALRGEDTKSHVPNNHTGLNQGYQDVVSSPPFRQASGGTPEPKPGGVIDAGLYKRHAAGNQSAEGYGATDGQLANMSAGDFDATVSSPPYADSVNDKNRSMDQFDWSKGKRAKMGKSTKWMDRLVEQSHYGVTEGQLGAEAGNDFWTAARTIVEQTFEALAPGGHAVWVVKAFVKDKQRVDFPGQWRQLCEAVGFETLHEHHAMLVHHKGKQGTLDGGVVEIKTESKSFFRRLAESKGSPSIDWETVYCMVKP